MGLMVFEDAVHRLVGSALRRPGDPHHRREQHQHQEDDPHDDPLPVFPVPVAVDQHPVEDEPQDRPDDEQEIGFRLHRVERKQARDQKEQRENDHQRDAGGAGEALRTAALLPGMAVNAVGNQAVDDGRAQRGDVHDPADRRPAQKGDEHGDDDDEGDRPAGDAVPVQLRERPRRLSVPSRRVQQAAQGQKVSDQARQDHAEEREHQHRDARLSEIVIRGVKSGDRLDSVQIPHIPDIGQPACVLRRVGGDGEQGHEQIQRRRHHHGADQDAAHLFDREAVFLGEMRDVLKADEGPGRDGGDADDLREGARPLGIQRGVAERAVMPRHCDHGAHRKADGERQRGDDHDAVGEARAALAQPADQDHGQHGQQRLAEPHLIAEDPVAEAEAEGAAEEEAGKQRQRGHVGPEDGQIGQQHEPEGEKTEILSPHALLKRVDTARVRRGLNHVLQVPGDHEDDRHAEQHAEDGAQHAGLLQIGVAGDDKRSPAYARPDRKGPHSQRREAAPQPGGHAGAVLFDTHVRSFLPVARAPVGCPAFLPGTPPRRVRDEKTLALTNSY